MRLLQVCHKPPFPPCDGGTHAMHQLTEELHRSGAEVHVVTLATPKHPYHLKAISSEYEARHHPIHHFVDATPRLSGALTSVLIGKDYIINRFYNADFEELLRHKLAQYEPDVILLESLFTFPYLSTCRENSSAKIVYRAHNIEYVLWQKRFNQLKHLIKKLILRPLIKEVEKSEKLAWRQADLIAAITLEDASVIQQATEQSVTTVPFGIKSGTVPTENKLDGNRLIFLGALDWEPNVEGLIWFLNHVWKPLNASAPKLEFHIAGRNASTQFERKIRLHKVKYCGTVERASAFIQSGALMVVPLFTGSGMRIKIIESMAYGVPVLATGKAMEGIAANEQQDYLRAENEAQFTDQILEYFKKSVAEREVISKRAQALVVEHYNAEKIGNDFYRELKALI